MKLTVSKSKNSASFYVQKTTRKPDGKVTTATIEKLGNLTEITAKAGGKDPYVWAQEDVNEWILSILLYTFSSRNSYAACSNDS